MRILQLLARAVPVQEGERAAVGILFVHYFLVAAAVIAGKSARDALFLSRYSKSVLPLMYLANALVITAAMSLLSRISRRFSPRIVSTGSLLLFCVSLLLIGAGLNGWMIAVFYVWMEVIGTVVVLQAWNLAGNALDPRQAKRLFGIIAAGGSIAAWAGGSAVAWLASRYGASSLVAVVALTLGIGAGTAWAASSFEAPRPKTRTATAQPRKLSPYVTLIATLLAASSVVSALVQYRFQVGAAAAYPERNQMLAFFGHFYAWTGASSLLAQVFLSRLLLSHFGIIAGLAVLPLSLMAGSLFTLFSPTLWSAGFNRFSDLTFKFTLNNSSVEMLWLPVPPEERQAVKPVVGGTLKAVSEAGTGLLMFVLLKFTPAWVLSALTIAVCGVWASGVVRLRQQYRSALARVIAKRQLSAEALRVDVSDPSVVASLDQALRSGDEAEQIAALSFLDGFPLSPWSATLRKLYREGSPEVRDAVLRVSAKDRKVIPDEWVLASLAEGVGVAARVAMDRKIEAAKLRLMDMMKSRDVRVSVAAAGALLRDGMAAPALARIGEWLEGSSPATAAQALDALPPEVGPIEPAWLRRWLRSSDPAAAGAALRAAAATKDERVVDDVVECLANPRCALQARLCLRQLREPVVVRALMTVVTGESLDERLRRAALRALRDYPNAVAEDRAGSRVSIERLRTYEEYAALLDSVKRVRPLEPSSAERAKRDLKGITEVAYASHALRAALAGDSAAILLRDRAEQQYSTAVAIVLRLTALSKDNFPVDACVQAARSGSRAARPYVFELLEASFPREQARALIALIEASQQQQAVRRERFEAHALLLPERLAAGVSSSDEWERAITSHYLARKQNITPEGNMISTLEKTIYLKSSSVFAGIPAENLSKLAAIAAESSWASGTVVFREGDPGDALYVVLSGAVRIVKGEIEIATMTKHACFGDMAVLDGAPRSAHAIVSEDAMLLRITSEEFYDVLAENPELVQGVIRLLTGRLREANARIGVES